MSIEFSGRVRAAALEAGVIPSAEYVAGEHLPANSPVCKGEADNRIYLGDASAWSRMPIFGVNIEEADEGDTVEVVQRGIARNVQRTEDFLYDDTVFVSMTRGQFTRTPPE